MQRPVETLSKNRKKSSEKKNWIPTEKKTEFQPTQSTQTCSHAISLIKRETNTGTRTTADKIKLFTSSNFSCEQCVPLHILNAATHRRTHDIRKWRLQLHKHIAFDTSLNVFVLATFKTYASHCKTNKKNQKRTRKKTTATFVAQSVWCSQPQER